MKEIAYRHCRGGNVIKETERPHRPWQEVLGKFPDRV
jgi:hypothetical protein